MDAFNYGLLRTDRQSFFELDWLERISAGAPSGARARCLADVRVGERSVPIWSIVVGPDDPDLPTYGLFAGVHGLERIGTHVALAFLESLFARMRWDTPLAALFEKCRLVSIPLLNPGGMLLGRRSNPSGVDLMRNAPVEADGKVPFLLGGQRISPRLPWYRGAVDEPMQPEAQAFVDFVERELTPSRAALALDVHSGFGRIDRLWFPYARTRQMFPGIDHVRRFKSLLDRSYPHHVYWIEQQSDSYTTHGDLWDYVYDRWRIQAGEEAHRSRFFIPWTLEMGSWAWVRKSPAQLFSSLGIFNPMKPHRYERILRRHMFLLEFFLRAVRNQERWSLNP